MPALLDLNLLTLSRQNGQDFPSLPGLYIATPPRRTHRNRSQDRLILYLWLAGNAPLTDEQQEQLLTRLAQRYYKSGGSITSAMRAIAESMNQYLLERNLRITNTGQQSVGILAIAVLRNDRLSIAHCGPAHTILLNPQEIQHIHDPQDNRGLGLTRSIQLRFYQLGLLPNDLVIIAASVPPTWLAILPQTANGQGLESLRRRLLSQAGADASAVILQAQTGTGKIRLLRAKAQPQKTPDTATLSTDVTAIAGVEIQPPVSPPQTPETIAIQAEPLIIPRVPAESEPENLSTVGPKPEEVTHTQEATASLGPVLHDERPIEKTAQPSDSTKLSPAMESPAARPAEPVVANQLSRGQQKLQQARTPAQSAARRISTTKTATRKKRPSQWAITFTSFRKVFRDLIRSISRTLLVILKRVLPDESIFTIPRSTMVFIAIAIPLVLTVTGGAVYIQRGRSELHTSLYEQALASANSAETQTDPLEIRTGWETTLDYIDQAETYQKTDKSQELRQRAQSALDQLDAIQRLDFQPAITGGLEKNVRISTIISTDTDLYLLHSNGELVERAIFTGAGYEVDPGFICGQTPGFGPIIDILALPKGNNIKATIIAMDANGDLLYCIPGQSPMSTPLVPPPINWGNPTAFALEGNDLYVLDPQSNAVWVYRNNVLIEQPHLFFDAEVPPMQDVIEFTVNRDDLYLLHTDGHITICTYSSLKESPTRCEDPATFTDSRPGRHSAPLILDAQFSQILDTQPPDPSIYTLDPIHQSIYHFSLRLNLQRQYRFIGPIPNEVATAFTVDANRVIFMAVGNQVYFASLP
jgi:hypothetical protein